MKPALLLAAASLFALAAPLLLADGFANPALKPSTPPLQNARVDGLDIDSGKLSVTDCAQPRSAPDGQAVCQGSSFDLTVDDEALRTKLKTIHIGDHIRVNFNLPAGQTSSPPTYKATGIAGLATPQISATFRVGVLFGSFAVTMLIGFILTRGQPLKLILGFDNRYSNSKLQAALWFLVLISSYLEFLYIRVAAGGLDFLGGISIPQNLFLLSGMSAVTFAGAKGITTAKANAYQDAQTAQKLRQAAVPAVAAAAAVAAAEVNNGDPEAVTVAAGPQGVAAVASPAGTAAPAAPVTAAVFAGASQPAQPKPREKTSRPRGEARNLLDDLMQNDQGDFDFGDFQMIIVTLLAVGTYLLAVHHALGAVQLSAGTSLPDLDTTILSAFGVGQGAYLAKKAVGNASQT